jgi:hypothetical protein
MLQVGQAAAKMRRMAASAKPKSTILNPMWKGSRNARRPQQGWAR